jgi:hypothetical protein
MGQFLSWARKGWVPIGQGWFCIGRAGLQYAKLGSGKEESGSSRTKSALVKMGRGPIGHKKLVLVRIGRISRVQFPRII